MDFKALHQHSTPILICNAWDVPSAKAAERLNFQAIGTSSSALAAVLGYEDGEEMSFSELEYMVGRIAKSTNLPLSVDLEAGYSRDPQEIVENIAKLAKLGVVGINLEDSLIADGKRSIVDASVFSELLHSVSSSLKSQNVDIYINVRTDAFLLGLDNAAVETILRSKKYESAGADGLFVPFIKEPADIETVLKEINLPMNVLAVPNLPDFGTLEKLGVKRISLGGFAFKKNQEQLEKLLENIQSSNSASSLFS